MFGVSDVAETVATRKDRFLKRYVLSSSIVCEICSICSLVFFFLVFMYVLCATVFSVNKDVCVVPQCHIRQTP